ncbi:MAG: response regulator [Puniceicoccaceae bacterium]
MVKEFANETPVVLLVDDQPSNLQLLSNSLLKLGYRTVAVRSGAEALKEVARLSPDLVLLDVMMPEMDGFEVCTRIKAEFGEDAPTVIFVTAMAETPDIVHGLSLGAVDYITKPIQIAEVNARVKAHVELRRTQRRMRLINRKLDQTIQDQNFFLSVLSHDFRAPLSGVVFYLEDLLTDLRSKIGEDEYEGLQMIQDSVSTMFRLLDELLDWARLQTDEKMVIYELVDLGDLVREVIVLFRAKAEAKQISFQSGLSESLSVRGDPRILSTVLRNLISNAIKFTPDGGLVRVEGKVDPQAGYRLSVEDSGVGIPEERLKTLFDKKVRESTLGTACERGAGIGLLLCDSLLELHGSKLQVESEVGRGTRFWFDISSVEP